MKRFTLLMSMLFMVGLVQAQVETTSYGDEAGTMGNYSSFYGVKSGRFNTASNNSFFGSASGASNTIAYNNSFFGRASGASNTEGNNNSFFGKSSGLMNQTGFNNTFFGLESGKSNKIGNYNTYIGTYAGTNCEGSGNVFIGNKAGQYETGSNRLYIANSGTNNPLIYGRFDNKLLAFNAKVTIGNVTIPNNDYKLFVETGILTEKVKVAPSDDPIYWADFVFDENYDRNTIEEVECYIADNKHLPNVPSAKEVNEKGVDMVAMDATLLRQIEELWLHVIDMKKENVELKKELEALKK